MDLKVCDMLLFFIYLGMKWTRAWSYFDNKENIPMVQYLNLNKSLLLSLYNQSAIFYQSIKGPLKYFNYI